MHELRWDEIGKDLKGKKDIKTHITEDSQIRKNAILGFHIIPSQA